MGETNEDDVAHAEADTFWVFEALVGEIAEMEEEDGGKIWTRKLSERIKWADAELASSIVRVSFRSRVLWMCCMSTSLTNTWHPHDSMRPGLIPSFRTTHSRVLSTLVGILLMDTFFWSVVGSRRY